MRKLSTEELNRPDKDTFKSMEKTPVVIILDQIRSLYNVGSVFRSADAFGISGIFLCGITATPPHRDILKTALGATETIPWQYFSRSEDAVARLKQEGYKIIAIEQTDSSLPLQNFDFSAHDKTAIVFGNEVKGVSDEVLALCDYAVEIPQFGTKHSFNVSVTAGIVLWEILREKSSSG